MIAASAINAQDCKIPLAVASFTDGEGIPMATEDLIRTKLEGIAIAEGDAVVGEGSSRFFIAARLNHISSDVLPGPPMQTSIVSTLTLYIGDSEERNVYATTSMEIRGVGNSEQRALISALRPLNAENAKVKAFMQTASDKIISYYDRQYPNMIAKAKRLAATKQYEESLAVLFNIPECCKGYGEAVGLGLGYYQELADTEGTKLLDMARSIWLASPDVGGASRALAILWTIPQHSSAYSDSQKLMAEIGGVLKDDKKFETRTKYKDAVDIKKMQIQAASAVGVAWGQGQQPTTTNVNWIR